MLAQIHLTVLRWAFQRFYREFAWTYDVVAWLVSRGLWRHWVLAALPYVHGRVLELGCGTGYIQHALAAQRFAHVVGLDASPQMLRRTQTRLARSHLQGRLLHAVAQQLPCASAHFHTVLATFPSEYIVHPYTLAEIHRVLVDSGRLILVDSAQFVNDGPYERMIDIAYRLTLQVPVRSTPVRDTYTSRVESAGFVIQTHWERVGPSQVLVVVATKQGMG